MPSNTDPNIVQQIADSLNRLPDGSGFFVSAMTLPKDHWIYQYEERPDRTLKFTDLNLEKEVRNRVTEALKYSIRVCTNHGSVMDIDPDAVIQTTLATLISPICELVLTFKEPESVE
jgi:hypothetical protein